MKSLICAISAVSAGPVLGAAAGAVCAAAPQLHSIKQNTTMASLMVAPVVRWMAMAGLGAAPESAEYTNANGAVRLVGYNQRIACVCRTRRLLSSLEKYTPHGLFQR